ncbi:hypothetical protein DW046_17175, partial [Bacteroides stercoris]
MSINCLGQNKLNRNQILDVARTHLQNHNNAPDVDSVNVIHLLQTYFGIIDNSISQSYMIIFNKKNDRDKSIYIDTILSPDVDSVNVIHLLQTYFGIIDNSISQSYMIIFNKKN